MTSRLGLVLDSAMLDPGIAAAVLVDSDGRVLEATSLVEGDLALAGAAANGLVKAWSAVGSDLGLGALQSLTIERPACPATIAPVGPNAALLVVGGQTCRPGRTRFVARRARMIERHEDPQAPEPEVSAAPQPVDRLDDFVREIHQDSPAQAPGLSMAEILLTGAHTFRLVTKLVAQLLQMKGVRSSCLRAYSPSSTIIDVVLEDGATLATIERHTLEEFFVERIEAEGSRLVLRPTKAPATCPAPIGSLG